MSETNDFDPLVIETIRAVDLPIPQNILGEIVLALYIRSARRGAAGRPRHVLTETFATIPYEIMVANGVTLELNSQEMVRLLNNLQAMASRLLVEHSDILDSIKESFLAGNITQMTAALAPHQSTIESMIRILLKTADLIRASFVEERIIISSNRRAIDQLKAQIEQLKVIAKQVPELNAVIEEARGKVESLEREIAYDDMTGLMTKRLFEIELSKLREGGKKVPIAFADFSGLKTINDMLGHYPGDMAIKFTADLIRQTVRHHDLVARLGGGADEFALAFETQDVGDLSRALARLMEAFDTQPLQFPIGEGHEFVKRESAEAYVRAWESQMPGYNRARIVRYPDGTEALEIHLAIAFGAVWLKPEESYTERLDNAEVEMYTAKDTSKGKDLNLPLDQREAVRPPQNAFKIEGEEVIVFEPGYFSQRED